MSASKRKLDQHSDDEDDDDQQRKQVHLADGNEADDAVAETIRKIANQHFGIEEAKRTQQLFELQSILNTAQETVNDLRHAIIAQHYHRPEMRCPQPASEVPLQTRIHPAVKKLLNVTYAAKDLPKARRRHWTHGINASEEQSSAESGSVEEKQFTKTPRYVPPTAKAIDSCNEGRRLGVKTLKRLLVGNVSRWLPLEAREDNASHKWMLYVRFMDDENPALHIAKVRFLLHPSYKPHDVVDVRLPPFHLSRRGWGEFQARVQVHFHNPADKPLDIRHTLKLDHTFTGLETLGTETHVNVWLHVDPSGESPIDAVNTGEQSPDIPLPLSSCDPLAISLDSIKQEEESITTSTSVLDTSWIKSEKPDVTPDIADQTSSLEEMFMADVDLDEVNCDEIKEEVVETCEETYEMPDEEEPPPTVNEEDIVAPDAETIPQKMMKIRFLQPDGKALYLTVDPKNVRRTNSKLSRCTISRALDRNPTRKQIAAMVKPVGMLNQNGFKIAHVPTQQGVMSKLIPISGEEKAIQRKSNLKTLVSGTESQLPSKVHPKVSGVSKMSPFSSKTVTTLGPSASTSSKPIIMLASLNSMTTTANKNSMQQVSVLTSPGRPGIQIVPNVRLVSPVRNPQPIATSRVQKLPTIRLVTPSRTLAQNTSVKQLPTLKLSTPPHRFINQPNSNLKLSVISPSQSIMNVRPSTSNVNPTSLLINAVRVSNPGVSSTTLAPSTSGKEHTKNLLVLKNGQLFIRPARLGVKTISVLNKPQQGGVSLLKPKSLLKTSVSPTSSVVVKSEKVDQGDSGKVIQSVEAPDGSVHVLYQHVEAQEETWYTVPPMGDAVTSEMTGRAKYLDFLSKVPLHYGVRSHDVAHAVSLALRHYPLVDPRAQDVQYRVVHPYCVASEETFLQGGLAKQRAAEWLRAKTVRKRLEESHWPSDALWSTYQIARYARRHGFTPTRGADMDVKVARNRPHTSYTQATEVKNYLATVASGDVSDDNANSDVEVVDIDTPSFKVKRERTTEDTSVIAMKPCHEEQLRCDFVRTAAAEIGVRLESEQIEPDVEYPAACVLILQAVKSLCDDLLRRSLCKAWERNCDRPPESLLVQDIQAAMLERPEFDMLTNSGLGTQPIDKG